MCVWLNLENRFGRKIPCYLPNRFSIKNPITEKTTEQALNPPALHWLVDLGSSGEEEELRARARGILVSSEEEEGEEE